MPSKNSPQLANGPWPAQVDDDDGNPGAWVTSNGSSFESKATAQLWQNAIDQKAGLTIEAYDDEYDEYDAGVPSLAEWPKLSDDHKCYVTSDGKKWMYGDCATTHQHNIDDNTLFVVKHTFASVSAGQQFKAGDTLKKTNANASWVNAMVNKGHLSPWPTTPPAIDPVQSIAQTKTLAVSDLDWFVTLSTGAVFSAKGAKTDLERIASLNYVLVSYPEMRMLVEVTVSVGGTYRLMKFIGYGYRAQLWAMNKFYA